MINLQKCYVKFIAKEEFVDLLKEYAKLHPKDLEIKSISTEEDGARLGFDIQTVAAVATIISSTLYLGELALQILAWMRKSGVYTVILQTPYNMIELHSSTPLTEEEVRLLLKSAVSISSNKECK